MAAPKPKPPPALTGADASAQAIINDYLGQIGLQALGNWAWQQYKQNNSTDLTKLLITERPEYKARFAGMLELRKNGGQMTEAQQLAYEQQARDLMQAAGMPKGFYDSWQDYTNLIGSGVSINELGTRINNAYAQVSQEPPEVKAALGQYYGAKTDQALAAMALDSKTALPILQNHIAAAEAGGYLAVQHFQISKTLAERIALATANSQAQIRSASQQMGQYGSAGLFEARPGEVGQTPTIEQGLEATFEGNQQAQNLLERTAQFRAASTAGGEQIDTSRYGGAGLGEASNQV